MSIPTGKVVVSQIWRLKLYIDVPAAHGSTSETYNVGVSELKESTGLVTVDTSAPDVTQFLSARQGMLALGTSIIYATVGRSHIDELPGQNSYVPAGLPLGPVANITDAADPVPTNIGGDGINLKLFNASGHTAHRSIRGLRDLWITADGFAVSTAAFTPGAGNLKSPNTGLTRVEQVAFFLQALMTYTFSASFIKNKRWFSIEPYTSVVVNPYRPVDAKKLKNVFFR